MASGFHRALAFQVAEVDMLLRAMVVLALLVSGVARAEEPEKPERAILLTLEWTDGGVSIKARDKKELVVPEQNGMPLLKPFYFVLQDQDKNVHYAGGLVDPRAMYAAHGKVPESAISRLVVPDLDEARHLIIYQRQSTDLKAGRRAVLEADL